MRVKGSARRGKPGAIGGEVGLLVVAGLGVVGGRDAIGGVFADVGQLDSGSWYVV